MAGGLAALDHPARRHAADYLYERAFAHERGPPVSRDDFLARLALESVTVNGNGTTPWYDDGHLYWATSVCVTWAHDGALGGAAISG